MTSDLRGLRAKGVTMRMFLKTVRSTRPRDWVILILMALLIAFGAVFGWSYGMSGFGGTPTIPNLVAFGLSLALTVVVALLILGCNAALTKLSFSSLNKDAKGEARPSRLERFIPKMTVKSVTLFALVIVIFWSPYVVAWFPGTMYVDTAVQMEQLYDEAHPLDLPSGGNYHLNEDEATQDYGSNESAIKRSQMHYVTDGWVIDHHPFALTLLWGGLALASDALFGNWFPAFAGIMIFQVIVLALELSYAVAFLRKKGAPPSLCLGALLFFCLVPVVPLSAVLVMKDTAFTICFIPYFLMLLQWMLGRGQLFKRKGAMVAFVLLGLGMCLTKKTGLYVVGATALFGLVLSLIRLRKGAKSGFDEAPKASALAFLLQGGASAVLMLVLLPFVVFPAMNIVPGSTAEALSFPLQQTARVYADHGRDAIAPQDRQAIQEVLYTSGVEYDFFPRVADRVKRRYNVEATGEDVLRYLGACAHMGLQFPASYLEAFIGLDAPYLSPVGSYALIERNEGWSLAFDGGREVLWELDGNAGMREALAAVVRFLDGIPVLNLLFRGVTYCLWVPALLLFFCLRNRLRVGVAFMPFVIVTLFCLIGPTYEMRYLMPEVMLAPVLLGAVVARAKIVFKARADARPHSAS